MELEVVDAHETCATGEGGGGVAVDSFQRLTMSKIDTANRSRSLRRAGGGKVRVTCHKYGMRARGRLALFAGRSDGSIVWWALHGHKRKKKQQDSAEKAFIIRGHKGKVTCIKYSEESNLLYTGSADRVVKIWDVSSNDQKGKCVQTLSAHDGTITDLDHGNGLLVTASIDCTVKVWKQSPDREHLLYPWMEIAQVINNGTSWISCLALRTGEATALFMCDSAGHMSMYTPPTSSAFASLDEEGKKAPEKGERGKRSQALRSRKIEFKPVHVGSKVHGLGITACLLIPEQNFIVTISFDSTARVFDASTGSLFVCLRNSRRCRFTGLVWDPIHCELVLADEKGFVTVWNIYQEKCLVTHFVGKPSVPGATIQLSFRPCSSSVFSSLAGSRIMGYRVKRDQHFKECISHVDAVVSIVSHKRRDSGEELTFSASLDNTIRAWDLEDLSCLYDFKEKKTEISCMMYLAECNLVVTGGDDGSVNWWNPYAGSRIRKVEHTNTVCDMDVAYLDQVTFLFTTGFDGQVVIWDVTHRGVVRPCLEDKFQAHRGDDCEIFCLVYRSPISDHSKAKTRLLSYNSDEVALPTDDGIFFTAGNSCVICIWNAHTRVKVSELEGHTDSVTSLVLDGNFVISGSEDKSIRIWNTMDAEQPYALSIIHDAHSCSVRHLLIIPDLVEGNLASCGFDGLVKIWDYSYVDSVSGEAGKLVHSFSHESKFRCLAYREKNAEIYVGLDSGTIFVFPIPRHLLVPSKQASVVARTELSSYFGQVDLDPISAAGNKK